MVKFTFVVRDKQGLQPKQAGELVREAAKCTSKVTLRKEEKTGDAKLIFNVMALFAKYREEVEVLLEGENEREEAAVLEAYIKEHI